MEFSDYLAAILWGAAGVVIMVLGLGSIADRVIDRRNPKTIAGGIVLAVLGLFMLVILIFALTE